MALRIYDFGFLRKRTVPLHCGSCWVKHPKATPVLVAMITRSRVINVIDDPLLDLAAEFDKDHEIPDGPLGEPGFLAPEDYAAHIVQKKDSVARVFRVVRDPKPVREDDVRDEIMAQRPDLSSEDLEIEITETIGPSYSTRSMKKGRLGMVEVIAWDEDLEHCIVDCHDCGTKYSFSRTDAATLATHINRHGGVGYATTKGLVVHGGNKEYRLAASR